MLADIVARDIHTTVSVTNMQGISEAQYQRLAEELGVTRSALTSFFKILDQQQVPPEDLDHTLRQIATSNKDLYAKLQHFTSDDPAIMALQQQAQETVEAGEFSRAEALLNDASVKDLEVADQFEKTATKRRLSAATSQMAIGNLKMTQLAYAEAIEYYRRAVTLDSTYAYAWHDLFVAYVALAQSGNVDLGALRYALQKVKETGAGRPGLGADYIAQLEAILHRWERPTSDQRRL